MVIADETSIMKVKDLFSVDPLITGRTETEIQTIGITDPPIGSVIAWLKTFSNTPSLPDGWVECNGQVLSDANSVYDGETIPDLNGDNRFLRGDSTSGGTGGSETQATELDDGSTFSTFQSSITSIIKNATGNQLRYAPATGGSNTETTADFITESFSILPPYYNMVWVMRVK